MEIQKLTAVSLGKKIKEKEISVREALDAVFAQIDQTEDRYHAYVTLDKEGAYKQADAVQEKIDNDAMLNGYQLIIGALCALLAMIGIANVFSNTLGFIRQRKREFARYMSIGMTPEGMRKMFRIEVLVIAGRPVLITLPVTVLFVWLMITASYLNPMEFLAVAPIVPILLFIAALFGFVALAYYLGGKKILKCDLVEALRTDYMG